MLGSWDKTKEDLRQVNPTVLCNWYLQLIKRHERMIGVQRSAVKLEKWLWVKLTLPKARGAATIPCKEICRGPQSNRPRAEMC